MKTLIVKTLIFTSALISPLVAQQAENQDSDTRKEILSEINNRFSNLPEETRSKYFAIKKDAYRYFNNKRTFECMIAIFELMEIFQDDPQAHNLLGSVYIEFRDFDRAREIFTHALTLSAEDSMILFNLAEIEFCTSNWSQALKRFQQVQTEQSLQQRSNLLELIDLKVMLCNLALSDKNYKNTNQAQKATHLDNAKKLLGKYTYLDDTPYYYYAHSALAYHEGDIESAQKWLRSARVVFTNPSTLSSWNDTFIEFGYITSHYGLDEEIEGDITE